MEKIQTFHIVIGAIILGVFVLIFILVQANAGTSAEMKTDAAKVLPSIFPTPSTFLTLDDIQKAEQNQKNMQQQAPQQQAPQQIQQQPPLPQEAAGVAESPDATVSAILKTAKGDIKLTLFKGQAKNTVANFINKAKSGFYTNLTFHRVEDWVIQGGDPKGNGTGGGNMLTEINDKPFVAGSLGVARGNNPQISNDAQFFITKQDASWLNNQYTNFGIVTEGMDVVNKIQIGDKILGITIE